MSVATPIVSPSTVSEARSLWARRALRHSAKLSRMANMAQQTSRVELYRISVGSIRRVSHYSVIGALLGMLTQVPAGLVAHVREQRMHAGHCDRALEIELGLVIFFRDRIVVLNGDCAQRLAASRDSVSDGKIVAKGHDRKQDESDFQNTQFHWQQDDDFEARGEKSNRRWRRE